MQPINQDCPHLGLGPLESSRVAVRGPSHAPVTVDGCQQLGDTLTCGRRRHQDLRMLGRWAARSGLARSVSEHGLELRSSSVRSWPIALVDDDDVGHLEQTGLDGLNLVAHLRSLNHNRGVGGRGHLDLALAGSDRLDQDQVEARGVEDRGRRGGGRREPTCMAARSHRADEHALVCGVGLHADAVAEEGAPGDRRGRIDGHDRDRMQAYASDDGVFIRSMASRGHAGGLAATSTSAATVLDAAGFDLVLLETVGTGQSEVEVAAAADTTVVLEAPEMGDEVQAIKAGLLEVADIVVVNKGDRPGAQRTAAQLRAMLTATASPRLATASPRLTPNAHDEAADHPRPKRPEVLITTATTGEGVPALLAALDRHRAAGRDGLADAARLARAEVQVWAIVSERLRDRFHGAAAGPATESTLRAVAEHRLDPYTAADRLLAFLTGGRSRA